MVENVISILSGLGIFLFGMFYLEAALKEAAGLKFKEILKKSTNTIPKSIATGAIATSILQSSSVISLMALSFVGAGLMQLSSGIGVIFGANIGTTATSWIVALVGFKVKIEVFAIPMVGLAGLVLITMGKYPKLQAWAKAFIGFGLLFMGLEFLKDSIEGFKSVFDLTQYLEYPPLTFLFIGFLLTAVIQSSSAATAIVLSSLYSGIITFEIAALMTIGTNVGTTVTALLGAIGGTADKKRVAISHMLFNVATGVVAYLLIDILNGFILNVLGFQNDLTTALAIFHTIFNIIGVLIFAPMIPLFSKILLKMFAKEEKSLVKYINSVDSQSGEASVIALKNETIEFFKKASKFGVYLQNIEPEKLKTLKVRTLISKSYEPMNVDYKHMYEDLKSIEISIIRYANKIEAGELSESITGDITNIIDSVKEVGFAVKTLKDIKQNMDEFALREEEYLVEFYNQERRQIIRLFKNLLLIIEGETQRELKAAKISNGIIEDNRESIKGIADLIKKYNLDDITAATMMNINRAMFMASDSLFTAVSEILFSKSNEELEEELSREERAEDENLIQAKEERDEDVSKENR